MLSIEINNAELHLTTRSVPETKAKDVLIKVYAAGVNRPDIMQRKGLYPAPLGNSDILGLEISGVVIKVGFNVYQVNNGYPASKIIWR